ncbi:MAG TPA: hypothetical protein VGD91_19395 [Trebonia sp.]
MSRINTLRTSTSQVAALAAELRHAAGSTRHKMVCHVRLHADGTVTAYDWRPDPLHLTEPQQQAVTDLMREKRRDIDWAVSHDYHLVTGMLRRSPEAGERGCTPEVEGLFGGTDPAFLLRPADGRRAA